MVINRTDRFLIPSVIFLAFSIFLSFYLMRYGINFNDEPFYMLYSEKYETGPMVSLTSVCYGLWAKVFGDSWIAYRTLAAIVFDLSVIITAAYYYRHTRNAVRALWVCALVILLMAMTRDSSFWLIGGDSTSILVCSVFAVCILSYISRPNTGKIVLVAAVGATMFWVRLPNIVNAVIAVAAIIYVNCFRHKDFKSLAVSMSVYIAVLVGVLWLWAVILYGGFGQYMYYMGVNSVGNTQSSYLYLITTPLYHTFVWIIPCVALIMMIAYFTDLSLGLRKRRVRIAVVAMVIIFGVLEILLLWRLLFLKKSILYVAILWFLCGYAWLRACNQGKSPVPVITVLLCSLITAAGSDTGLTKSSTFAMVPLLLIYVQPDRLFKCMAVFAAASVFVVNVFVLQKATFCDAGLPKLTTEVDHPKLRGLRTTEERARYLSEVIADEAAYGADRQTMVIGNSGDRLILEYLFTGKNLTLGNPFSDHDFYRDPYFVDAVDAELAGSAKPVMVLFLRDIYGEGPTLMQEMIERHFSHSIERPRYIIYY